MSEPQSALNFRVTDPFIPNDVIVVTFAASKFDSTWKVLRNKIKNLKQL